MRRLLKLLFLITFVNVVTPEELEVHYESSKFDTFSEEYYCENMPGIPLSIKAKDDKNKMCRYREEGLFPMDIFRWRSGAGCWEYIPESWLSQNINTAGCERTVNGKTYKFNIGAMNNLALFFDYTHKRYSEMIASAFKSRDLYLKWENCARNADACCRDIMTEQNVHPNDEYPCPAIWDAWSCFHPARPDTISEEPCPDYTSTSNNAPCILYSQKECFSNRTWNQQTEYGTCASAPVYRRRHNFHVIVLYVSIALSLPAVLVFVSYKNLRILRVNLHRNLLIACILRNIFTIVSKEVAILDSLKPSNETNDVLEKNGVPCRVLAYYTSVFANAIYACMLVDGFYLHKLIVRVFAPDPNVYIMYGVTAVFSFLPTTIWAIMLAIEADEYCWMTDNNWYQWIPDGFRIGILCVNIILLLDIIRALLTKLKKNVSAQHTKYTYILINGKSINSILRKASTSTLRAMGFLIPLFGIPFIITANRDIIDTDSCSAGDIYYYVSYLVQALQGIVVALLFCYLNKEVHTQIKGTYRKLMLRYENQFGSKNLRRPTNRRDTAATYVHNSVAPNHNNFDEQLADNSNKRINDWLTENKDVENSGPLPLEPTEKNGQVQFSEVDSKNQTNPFDRISKFIDESSDNQQEQGKSTTDDNLKS